MITDVVNTILDIAKKHISINSVEYKKKLNINDSHNSGNFQFILTDDGLFEKQLVEGVSTIKLNGYIVAFSKKGDSVIQKQDEAMHIFLDILEYIGSNELWLETRDYSAIGISEYSDNNCSGIYFSIQFIIPTPVNLCEWESHFIDKPDEPIKYTELADSDPCTNESRSGLKTLNLRPKKM